MEYNYSNQTNRKIRIDVQGQTKMVEVEAICYLICDCYVTTLYMVNGKSISICRILKQMEELLSHYGFIRISRNTMVNPRHIEVLKLFNKNRSVIVKGFELKVSRRRAYLLKERKPI